MVARNTIIRGDCLTILRTLPDNSVDTIITDPPFGIDYQSSRTDKTKRKPKIANDKSPFIWWMYDAFRVLKDPAPLICFTRFDTEEDFRWAMGIAGFRPRAQVIWDKRTHGMGDLKGNFAPQHENIIFATKGKYAFPYGRPKSILSHCRVSPGKLLHPNEKPESLLADLVNSLTRPGELILDPFIGSGVTAIVARQLGRDYLGIELNPEYIEIAKRRIRCT